MRRHKDFIDASLGDPLTPLSKVATHAFRQSRASMGRYLFNNPGSADGDPAHWQAMATIARYFTKRGLTRPGWTGLPLSNLLLTGGGTTEGYELIIRALAADIREQNEKHRRGIKPVILMPVPTYGYFFDQPQRYGIEIARLPLDLANGGRLSARELHRAIEAINREGKRVVAFYMPNPHNPLGSVRGEEETRQLAAVLAHHNRLYEQKEWARVKKGGYAKREPGEDDEHSIIFRPYKRRRWDSMASRIHIIDDMVYDGLEYGERKAFGFAQVAECFENTFTLFGLSKVGLPNVRAGVVIGSDENIRSLMFLQRECSYFPQTLAMHALETYCAGEEPYASWREKHLQAQREHYRFNGLFMKALINGLTDVPEATEHDRTKMINLLVRHKKCSKAEAFELLNSPLARAKVITSPEAGFFHLIDISALKDSSFPNEYTRGKCYPGLTETFRAYGENSFADNSDLVFAGHDIKLAPGAWAGSGMDEMLVRVTFAMKPAQIIAFADRFAQSLATFRFNPVKPVAPGIA